MAKRRAQETTADDAALRRARPPAAPPSHPALHALARILARQAAAEVDQNPALTEP